MSAFSRLWGGSSSSSNLNSPQPSKSENFEESSEEQIDESNIATNNVPESERSSFLAFVKRAMGGIDLSKITAPPFILAPYSLLEANAELMGHPEIFCRIAQKEDKLARFVEYTRWYISRFHKQSLTGSGKKPYNPILGERFLCYWEHPDFGRLDLTTEQVSHHPPVLAEYYENRKLGIVNLGHFGLKSNFSGTVVKARVEAHNWTRLVFHEEDYIFTSPTFVIRGFLVANPFFDAVGDCLLHCPTTGYKAVLDFKDKPWFRGEYHQMTGKIFHSDDPQTSIYTIAGNWKKEVTITEVATGKTEILFDSKWEIIERSVKPLEEQHELESQKVWERVTKGLLEFDYSSAGQAKTEIEERQRALARQRQETGEEFKHHYFYFDSESGRWLLHNYEARFEELEKEKGSGN